MDYKGQQREVAYLSRTFKLTANTTLTALSTTMFANIVNGQLSNKQSTSELYYHFIGRVHLLFAFFFLCILHGPYKASQFLKFRLSGSHLAHFKSLLIPTSRFLGSLAYVTCQSGSETSERDKRADHCRFSNSNHTQHVPIIGWDFQSSVQATRLDQVCSFLSHCGCPT